MESDSDSDAPRPSKTKAAKRKLNVIESDSDSDAPRPSKTKAAKRKLNVIESDSDSDAPRPSTTKAAKRKAKSVVEGPAHKKPKKKKKSVKTTGPAAETTVNSVTTLVALLERAKLTHARILLETEQQRAKNLVKQQDVEAARLAIIEAEKAAAAEKRKHVIAVQEAKSHLILLQTQLTAAQKESGFASFSSSAASVQQPTAAPTRLTFGAPSNVFGLTSIKRAAEREEVDLAHVSGSCFIVEVKVLRNMVYLVNSTKRSARKDRNASMCFVCAIRCAFAKSTVGASQGRRRCCEECGVDTTSGHRTAQWLLVHHGAYSAANVLHRGQQVAGSDPTRHEERTGKKSHNGVVLREQEREQVDGPVGRWEPSRSVDSTNSFVGASAGSRVGIGAAQDVESKYGGVSGTYASSILSSTAIPASLQRVRGRVDVVRILRGRGAPGEIRVVTQLRMDRRTAVPADTILRALPRRSEQRAARLEERAHVRLAACKRRCSCVGGADGQSQSWGSQVGGRRRRAPRHSGENGSGGDGERVNRVNVTKGGM
ncbi:hypothetical protein GGX14DRAFT_391159 [Mycena pura]|uniref:Uncharacterized protein n=1 Tax=Mycena pura TaxID=153505 RepID=A0AAD6YJP7_9AGAR|nr:hypothetical protein GGX14DRAFT_391159 [Mycena pura]